MSQETTLLSTSYAKVSHALKLLSQLWDKREVRSGTCLTANRCHPQWIRCGKWFIISYSWQILCKWRGSQTLIEMMNFSPNEFECLWHHCDTILTQSLTIGRGKKTDVTPKDLLFIVLCVLKAATNWDLVGGIFAKKGPRLQRLFSCALLSLPLWGVCQKLI